MSATQPATIVRAAGLSIIYNVLVQIMSRLITFILGAITLKYLRSSALLGIVNVRLALLYTTLQFLSREPFRRACLREATKSGAKWSKLVNVVWIGLPLSILLSFMFGSYIWPTPNDIDLEGSSQQDYKYAVLITCISVIVEMTAEVCHIYALSRSIVRLAPLTEGLAVFIRCVLITAVTLHDSLYQGPTYILSKIAICQFISSASIVIFSYTYLSRKSVPIKSALMPFCGSYDTDESQPHWFTRLVDCYFDSSCLSLSWNFMRYAAMKQILTDGERYIMTFFNLIDLQDQGIYDVVNNLGSLTARLLFRPIEDSGFALFSQLINRRRRLDESRFAKVKENLLNIVKSMLIIGLVIFTFGFNFAQYIIIYGGDKLNNTAAFNLMRWHFFYTPFLAINGVTECFTMASMSQSQLNRNTKVLVVFSLVFLATVFLTKPLLGSGCFILANCCNMTCRVIFAYHLISEYFRDHGSVLKVGQFLPSKYTFFCLTSVFIILSISRELFLTDLTNIKLLALHFSIGMFFVLFVMIVLFRFEKSLSDSLKRLFKRSK